MPRVFVPHKSPAHRLTCLSLYRALLRASTDLSSHLAQHNHPFPASALHALIRHRFRQDSRVDRPLPPTAIANALTTGHEHLTLLHNATTSPAALTRLLALLTSTSSDLASRIASLSHRQALLEKLPKKHLPQLRHIAEATDPVLQTPPKDVPGVFGPPLPLSQIKSGKRVVPHLVTASVGGVPLLRYKIGRAPPWLRRIVRQKGLVDLKRQAMDGRLEMMRDLAMWEDRWEAEVARLVRREGGKDVEIDGADDGDGEVKSTYRQWPQRAKYHEHQKAGCRKWDDALRGWRLWQKVKREKWLAEKETAPDRLAWCVKKGQILQRELVRAMAWRQKEKEDEGPYMSEPMPPWRAIGGRDEQVAEEMVTELQALGPLEVPVEWSERVVDRQLPKYLTLEADRLGIDWRAQMPRSSTMRSVMRSSAKAREGMSSSRTESRN